MLCWNLHFKSLLPGECKKYAHGLICSFPVEAPLKSMVSVSPVYVKARSDGKQISTPRMLTVADPAVESIVRKSSLQGARILYGDTYGIPGLIREYDFLGDKIWTLRLALD